MKLFSNNSNQLSIYVITIPQRYGQTDGQTTFCSNAALCVATRGKKQWKLESACIHFTVCFRCTLSSIIACIYICIASL